MSLFESSPLPPCSPDNKDNLGKSGAEVLAEILKSQCPSTFTTQSHCIESTFEKVYHLALRLFPSPSTGSLMIDAYKTSESLESTQTSARESCCSVCTNSQK